MSAQRVVLITGGGTGIGAAVARRAAADGDQIVVTGRREGPIRSIATETGGHAIVADAADPAVWSEVIEQVQDRFGGLDVLVANAGVEAFGSAEEVDLDAWRDVQRVNVDGTLLSCRAAIPALRARGGGAIVVIASVAALVSGPHYASYVTSKTALLGLVRSMAVDLGRDGIRVNALCPGWTRTEMSEREVAEMAQEKGIGAQQMWDRLTGFLPLQRAATAEELAGCVRFLAGSDASFVTGAVLVADGGGHAVDVGTLGFGDLVT